MRSFALYVHIPYCLHRCPYCDFNTYALTTIPEKDYLAALLSELDYRGAQADWLGRRVQSVYFGGGTPSLFSPNALGRLLESVNALFHLDPSAEITVEANPGTVETQKLRDYRAAGINRVSLGAQSFTPEILRTLGRMHSVEQTEAAIASIRDAGFDNFGLDLIYGVPGQGLEQLRFDLKEIVRHAPRHISAYGLTIEKGTPFYTRYRKGDLVLPSEEVSVQMLNEVSAFLPSCGYQRYEISNFAERGFEAQHNMVYWNGGDYLGLGAGAHSLRVSYQGDLKVNAKRWSNYALPNKYMKQAVASGHAEGWQETLNQQDLMFEFFFLGLRKLSGISRADFENQFNHPLEANYGPVVEILRDQNLLVQERDLIRLSDRGLELADSVIENFAGSP